MSKEYSPRVDYDAVVVGSGISGRSTASVLAENGLSVALIEKNSQPEKKSLFANPEWLEATGVLKKLLEIGGAVTINRYRLINADNPSRNWAKDGNEGCKTYALFHPKLILSLDNGASYETIEATACWSEEVNGPLVAVHLDTNQTITSSILVDASGSKSATARNHLTQDRAPLLQDDPYVLWVRGFRARGEFIPQTLIDPIGRKIGLSWILPYSDTEADIIAADYCRMSSALDPNHKDQEKQTLRALLRFCEKNNLAHVEKEVHPIKAFIRAEPISRRATRSKQVYITGDAAGMGSPLMQECIPPAIIHSRSLGKLIPQGVSPGKFWHQWRYRTPTYPYDLELAMLHRRIAYAKKSRYGSNTPIYQAILKHLPEEAQKEVLTHRRIPPRFLYLVIPAIMKNPHLTYNLIELSLHYARVLGKSLPEQIQASAYS